MKTLLLILIIFLAAAVFYFGTVLILVVYHLIRSIFVKMTPEEKAIKEQQLAEYKVRRALKKEEKANKRLEKQLKRGNSYRQTMRAVMGKY